MKKSLKLLCVLAIFLFSFQSYSQAIMGFKGGVNYVEVMADGETSENSIGYHIGIQFEYLLSDVFSVESGMYWSTKQVIIPVKLVNPYSGEPVTINAQMNSNYLDWPITIKVGLPIGDNFKIYVAGGGFLNWGLSGKIEYAGESTDIWSKDREYLTRYDYGATFGAGIEIYRIQISASYDLGLANISNNSYAVNQSVLKASVAYLFW